MAAALAVSAKIEYPGVSPTTVELSSSRLAIVAAPNPTTLDGIVNSSVVSQITEESTGPGTAKVTISPKCGLTDLSQYPTISHGPCSCVVFVDTNAKTLRIQVWKGTGAPSGTPDMDTGVQPAVGTMHV